MSSPKNIFTFLRLRGDTLGDNLWVQLAKTRFLLNYIRGKTGPCGLFLCRDVTLRTSYGRFRCRKGTNDLDIAYEGFESEILSVFKPKSGDNVVDCGAHIGKYTILTSKLVGKDGHVVAIEPSLENYEILLVNLRLNRCENVAPMNCAAWRDDEEVILWVSESMATHSLKPNWDRERSLLEANERESVKVRGLKLDDLLQSMVRIDWLKLDVEGSELDVLLGATESISERKIHNIIVEASDESSLDFLEKNGYLLTRISTLRPYYHAKLK